MATDPIPEADTPFLHHPDKIDDDVRNGLMCFLNGDRQCGADCMAYTTEAAQSQYLSQQQAHCSFVVAVERLGRNTGILAKILNDGVGLFSNELADKKRTGQVPVQTGLPGASR